MPDMFMDVDTALSEVPVNLMPLVDDTDFKTRETAVLYNAAGMDLVWNFVTTAGAYTQTAVTPTTGGSYDWTHQGDGMYSIEIPATGGASINNDTEGFGWFSGVVTGVLPFRGPVIGFRAAALNDALIDGGDLLDVNVTQFGGTNATTSGGRPEVNTTHAAGTAWGSGAVTAASIAASALNGKGDWNVGKSGYALSSAGIQAIWDALTSALTTVGSIGKLLVDNIDATISSRFASASYTAPLDAAGTRSAVGLASANLDTQLDALPTAAENADAVWDEVIAGHLTGGSTGNALNAAGSAGDPWSTAVPGAYIAGSAGYILGNRLDVVLSTRLATSGYTAPLDAAGTRSAVGLAAANLDTQLAALAAYIDTEIAAIKAKTDNLPVDPADASDIATSFGSITTLLNTISGYIDTEVAAIKVKTDQLVFTKANEVDVNIQSVNGVTVAGTGAPGDEWGP